MGRIRCSLQRRDADATVHLGHEAISKSSATNTPSPPSYISLSLLFSLSSLVLSVSLAESLYINLLLCEADRFLWGLSLGEWTCGSSVLCWKWDPPPPPYKPNCHIGKLYVYFRWQNAIQWETFLKEGEDDWAKRELWSWSRCHVKDILLL